MLLIMEGVRHSNQNLRIWILTHNSFDDSSKIRILTVRTKNATEMFVARCRVIFSSTGRPKERWRVLKAVL